MSFPPLDVLAHVERRHLLTELSKADGQIDVAVTKSLLAGGVNDSEVLTDILYYHLPKMAEHGYVTFDREERTIGRGPRFDAIRPYLVSTNGHRDATDRD